MKPPGEILRTVGEAHSGGTVGNEVMGDVGSFVMRFNHHAMIPEGLYTLITPQTPEARQISKSLTQR
jgi:hypothetical protein